MNNFKCCLSGATRRSLALTPRAVSGPATAKYFRLGAQERPLHQIAVCQFENGVEKVTISYEGVFNATMQFDVVLDAPPLQPTKLGCINRTAQQLQVVLPDEVWDLSWDALLSICVIRTDFSVALRSAEEAFYLCVDDLTVGWRQEVLATVAAAIADGHLDSDRQVTVREVSRLVARMGGRLQDGSSPSPVEPQHSLHTESQQLQVRESAEEEEEHHGSSSSEAYTRPYTSLTSRNPRRVNRRERRDPQDEDLWIYPAESTGSSTDAYASQRLLGTSTPHSESWQGHCRWSGNEVLQIPWREQWNARWGGAQQRVCEDGHVQATAHFVE